MGLNRCSEVIKLLLFSTATLTGGITSVMTHLYRMNWQISQKQVTPTKKQKTFECA